MCNRRPPVGLLRHPPVQADPSLCYGRRDVALAPDWPERLAAQLWRLRPLRVRLIHSSPQRRCQEPASWLAGRLGVTLRVDERLRELDFGTWEGRPWADIDRPLLDLWAANPLAFRPPGGESGAELVDRVARFTDQLRATAEPCLVVSHGGPLRLLPDLLRGKPAQLLTPPPPPGRLRITRLLPMQ